MDNYYRRLRDLREDHDRTQTEIAEYLGYSSQSHFQRVFRKCTGMTPGQYKSQEANK